MHAGFAVLATLAIAAGPRTQDRRDDLAIRVDPRVELLSVVFRLAGNPEYSRGRVDRYTAAVDAHFGAHRDHRVVALARELRGRRGIAFDAVAGFAIHLTGVAELGEVVPFSPRPDGLDARWTPDDARAFAGALRAFVADTEFETFFASQAELFAVAVARMRARIAASAELAWFDTFFGARPSARFELALAMLNGGQCYGPHVTFPDGREDLHCVLGVWATDDDGWPVFDDDVVATVVHEFCHSYCNRLVDAHLDALAAPAAVLWPHVAEAMRAQAYTNPATMLRESLVRACVIRYEAAHRGPRARLLAIRNEERKQFLWAGALSDLLVDYEDQREEFATLDAFMPRVVAFFERYAEQFAARIAAVPRIVSMRPDNGARDVDPGLGALVITFDRPMQDRSWSFVGGGPRYPKTTGQPRYDRERKVITLPVALEPGHDYELWLNSSEHESFRSADGIPLSPVHVTFRTRE